MIAKDGTNWLPASTEELLEFLPELYKAEELVSLTLSGDHQGAVKLAAKIEFINELRELWDDQKKQAAQARAV